jgi:hypothetical protein
MVSLFVVFAGAGLKGEKREDKERTKRIVKRGKERMCLMLPSGVEGDVRNMNMSGVVGAAPLGRKQDRGVACRVGVRVRVRRCGSGTCDLLRRDAAAASTDGEKPTCF